MRRVFSTVSEAVQWLLEQEPTAVAIELIDAESLSRRRPKFRTAEQRHSWDGSGPVRACNKCGLAIAYGSAIDMMSHRNGYWYRWPEGEWTYYGCAGKQEKMPFCGLSAGK